MVGKRWFLGQELLLYPEFGIISIFNQVSNHLFKKLGLNIYYYYWYAMVDVTLRILCWPFLLICSVLWLGIAFWYCFLFTWKMILLGVVVLTFILNKFRLDKINGVDQFVMAYGGLRGAIAFSLVSLTSPEIVPAIKTMICACIVCILFTSFVQVGYNCQISFFMKWVFWLIFVIPSNIVCIFCCDTSFLKLEPALCRIWLWYD